MKKKILFRADGNQSIGLGHLYRLFAVIEMLKNEYDFCLVTRSSSTTSVIPENYRVRLIPDEIDISLEPDWLQHNFEASSYIIIADGYQFDSIYQKNLKGQGYKSVYIDDLAKEYMYADVVINHSPYIQEKHYRKEDDTKLALGTQYALLRPLFLKEAKQYKRVTIIDSAFVCFGGADPFDLTLKAVEALLRILSFKNIYVVVGGAYKHHKIFDLKDKYSDKINIHKNLSEEALIAVMQSCNFAVAPASTILYELACVKMPILSGFYVDNQELIYKGFLNHEAIYNGGNMKDYKVSDFVNKIEVIIKENKFANQIEAQKELFDDKIVSRHLNLILELC